jgi:Ca2+-binding RTX toxin-like protein
VTFAGSGTATIANVENIVAGADTNIIVLDEDTSDYSKIELGTGDDSITMGLGLNTVYGGTGTDQFIFTSASQSTSTKTDVIADFTTATDDLVFSGLLTGTFNYLGNATSFSATSNSQAYFSETGDKLYVDVNGDATTDMVIQLTGVDYDDLTTGDFVWS